MEDNVVSAGGQRGRLWRQQWRAAWLSGKAAMEHQWRWQWRAGKAVQDSGTEGWHGSLYRWLLESCIVIWESGTGEWHSHLGRYHWRVAWAALEGDVAIWEGGIERKMTIQKGGAGRHCDHPGTCQGFPGRRR